MDIVWLAVGLAFFALSAAALRFLDRLRAED